MVGILLKTIVSFFAVSCVFAEAGEGGLLHEARKCAAAGVFEKSITEYERYLFFAPDSPAVQVYLSIASLCRKLNRFEGARKALRSALARAATDSMRYEIRMRSAFLDAAEGRYASAITELIRISSFATSQSQRFRARFFLFVAYVRTGTWDEASAIVEDSSFSADGRLLRCRRMLKSGEIPTHKSPAIARWMSTVVPGLGQMYAHDISGGINAFAVSFVAVFLTANSIINGYYSEAVLTDAMLFWRYYSGNRWNAAAAAERYNARKNEVLRDRLLGALFAP
jgi:tetratricopeptide (TPR) repeat protein